MSEADAYRARGYVLFEAEWMTPYAKQSIERERAAPSEWQRARRASKQRREAEERQRRERRKERTLFAPPVKKRSCSGSVGVSPYMIAKPVRAVMTSPVRAPKRQYSRSVPVKRMKSMSEPNLRS